jgi:hypothetical protein
MEEAKQRSDAGTLPYPGAVGFSEEVWNTMCLEVQQRVTKLFEAESKLIAVKALSNMRADIDQKDAAMFDIKVLLASDSEHKIQLGVFDVPALENFFEINAPKGSVFTFSMTLTSMMRSRPSSLCFCCFVE